MNKQRYRITLLFGLMLLTAAVLAGHLALARSAMATGQPGHTGRGDAGRSDTDSQNAAAGTSTWAWKPQVVDMPGHFGDMSDHSLAFDESGTAYLAYGGDRLHLARWNGEAWSSEVVDGQIGVGAGASLALDADGRPYIAYLDTANARVMVAHWNGAIWLRQVVAPTVESGRTAIALDTLGRPHVAYRMNLAGPYTFCRGMGYASWSGSEWQIEKFSDCGTLPSLVLDALDRPHISFYDESGRVKYATRPAAGWRVETVDLSSGGYGSAIAADNLDRPHVVYVSQGSGGQLMHATPGDQGWQREALRNGKGGLNVSLAIDDSGLVHIAHGSFYMTTTVTITVDTAAGTPALAAADDVAQYTSIALDKDNRPAISYVDVGSALKCARLIGEQWHTDVIATGGSAGGYNSIAIDDLGQPYIGYITGVSWGMTVKYAHRSGDTWLTETITGAVDAETHPTIWGTDLAVSDDGAPHVVFLLGHLGAMSDLYYGRRVSDTWQLELLVEQPMGTPNPALAVDSQGRPHFVFKPDWRLLYGIREADGWQISELTFANTRTAPAFVLDDADNPHLVYVDDLSVKETLRYSFWNGSEWTHSDIEDLYTSQFSLALDSFGQAHVAYISSFQAGGTMHYNLKYSYFDGDTWTLELVDDRPGEKPNISLALDAIGDPQIVYSGEYGSPVQVATRRGGQWRVEPLLAARSGPLDSAIRGEVNIISHGDPEGGRLMVYEQIEVFPQLYLPIAVDASG